MSIAANVNIHLVSMPEIIFFFPKETKMLKHM